jgi:hypothetical protein
MSARAVGLSADLAGSSGDTIVWWGSARGPESENRSLGSYGCDNYHGYHSYLGVRVRGREPANFWINRSPENAKMTFRLNQVDLH